MNVDLCCAKQATLDSMVQIMTIIRITTAIQALCSAVQALRSAVQALRSAVQTFRSHCYSTNHFPSN